jgi:hypothetical protein
MSPVGFRPRADYGLVCRCGEALIAPEWSEHVSEHRIRHLWACETCGDEFETSISLRAEAA